MDNEAVYWHLPGIYHHFGINHILFMAMNTYPEMFREGYKIGSVYGTFPSAIWNGGRFTGGRMSSQQEVAGMIQAYNNVGVPVRFTWTNSLIEEKHLSDPYCNMIMNVGNNGMNQVLVSSSVMEDYVRQKYPSYKIISSTTKRILSPDTLMEELSKDYQLVVLDYDFNHNEKVIEQLIPFANKIEIVANETCQPHCPRRVNHYREISKCQLDLKFSTRLEYICTDASPSARTFKGCMQRPAFMSTSAIEAYTKKGFHNYKIVGRGLPTEFYLDSLMYYLVKPENRDFIRSFIMDTMDKMKKMAAQRQI